MHVGIELWAARPTARGCARDRIGSAIAGRAVEAAGAGRDAIGCATWDAHAAMQDGDADGIGDKYS